MHTHRRVIYLSGPMTGYPAHNYPLFNQVARELRPHHEVYNPAEFKWEGGDANQFPIRAAFEEYTSFLCRRACTIVLLPRWRESLGVSAEVALAKNLKLDFIAWLAEGHYHQLEIADV